MVEAVIMRDRTTGRARGFGFIVFSNAYVAERVVRERHDIDGRTVEAKKAVPRDDQQTTFIKTKKRKPTRWVPRSCPHQKDLCRGQFGTTTDVVVMYDHNTQMALGFGFITYDSEDSVDRVLVRTFHELSGKMVEVKRAVPKEVSSSPARSPVSSYSYGPTRMAGFLNSYSPGNNYGMRVDGRFSPVSTPVQPWES